MKLIIAGSRHLEEPSVLPLLMEWRAMGSDVTEVVSGGCRGVDAAGELYASYVDLPVKQFPADWKTHGRAAGPIRNKQMAEYADALLLIWDGKSRGSQNMKYCMRQFNKPVYEIIVE